MKWIVFAFALEAIPATVPVPAVPNLGATPTVPSGGAPLPAVSNVATTSSPPATSQPVPAVPNLNTAPSISSSGTGLATNVATPSSTTTPSTTQNPVVSDLELERRIQQELMLSSPGFSSGDVVIDSSRGQVTIQGTVPSQTEANRIANTVRSVEGVRGITNRMNVEP